ncbi:unnamed protein product, partial [Heterosigma akashiwo]
GLQPQPRPGGAGAHGRRAAGGAGAAEPGGHRGPLPGGPAHQVHRRAAG